MTDAENAYEAADAKIKQVIEAGERRLTLDTQPYQALETLPERITQAEGVTFIDLFRTQVSDVSALSGLKDLQVLYLNHTQVSDVSALYGLTGLQDLDLSNTNVSDLRGLRGLSALIATDEDGGSITGLHFRNTPATTMDPELKRLSEIEDNQERTRETFAYLDGLTEWPPRGVPDARAEGEVLYLPDNGPLQRDEQLLGAAQRDVAEIHDEVRRKVARLLEAFGATNEFGHVRDSAERYNVQVLRNAEEISVDALWSAYNSLRTAYEADNRAEEMHRTTDLLPPAIASALRDLVETHGVFASAFEAYKELEAIARESLEGPAVAADTLASAGDVARLAVETHGVMDESASGPLADTMIAAKEDTPSGQMARRRLVGSVWNAIGTIGRKIWVAVKSGSAAILAHDVVQFLLNNQTVIQTFWTKAMGPAGDWFRIAMEALQKLL